MLLGKASYQKKFLCTHLPGLQYLQNDNQFSLNNQLSTPKGNKITYIHLGKIKKVTSLATKQSSNKNKLEN